MALISNCKRLYSVYHKEDAITGDGNISYEREGYYIDKSGRTVVWREAIYKGEAVLNMIAYIGDRQYRKSGDFIFPSERSMQLSCASFIRACLKQLNSQS